jgi:hypothetical protein
MALGSEGSAEILNLKTKAASKRETGISAMAERGGT